MNLRTAFGLLCASFLASAGCYPSMPDFPSQLYLSPASSATQATSGDVVIRAEFSDAILANGFAFVCERSGDLPYNGRLGTVSDGGKSYVYYLKYPDGSASNELTKMSAGTGADEKSFWVFAYRTAESGWLANTTTTHTFKIAPYDERTIPADPVTVIGRVKGGDFIEWRRGPGTVKFEIVAPGIGVTVHVAAAPINLEAGKKYLIKSQLDSLGQLQATVSRVD